MAAFFGRLARCTRLIVFDTRGTGLSDRVPVTEIPPLEERMDDVGAVMDAAGSELANGEALAVAIPEFMIGAAPAATAGRVLTTVLFVDVVDSTEPAERIGDDSWRRVLRRFHDVARDELVLFRGGEVATTGDGLLATFDGPARAVRCGQSLQRSVAGLGLTLRIGVHTAEVERLGDDLTGVGVHIGARVAAASVAGEVWITRTVRDLVAGSGLQFEGRGLHQLRGASEPWELYAAA